MIIIETITSLQNEITRLGKERKKALTSIRKLNKQLSTQPPSDEFVRTAAQGKIENNSDFAAHCSETIRNLRKIVNDFKNSEFVKDAVNSYLHNLT